MSSGNSMNPRARLWLLRGIEIAAPMALIALWWFVSEGSRSLYWPPLRDIIDDFWRTWVFGHWHSHAVPTLTAILLGYAVSLVAGLTIGIALGLLPSFNEFVRPALDFFRAAPSSASVPLLIILVGVNIQLKIAVVMMAAVWVVIMNTSEALAGIDTTIRDTCRSYRLSFWQKLLWVYLPAASPQVFAGMRVALFQSIILTIVAEMLASSSGIGTFISAAQWSFKIVDMWTGIVMVAALSFALTRAFHHLEHKVLAWHRGYHRRQS